MNTLISTFIRNNRLARKVILIDGPPRAGKSLTGQLVSSYENIENERMDVIIEQIAILYHHNKISRDASIALLRREIDQILYDSMLARNTNFRWGDRTSIFNNFTIIKYFKRLFEKDGLSVLERIKNEKPGIQFMTHDVLQKSDILFEAIGSGLRIIEMVRNPIDLIYSMHLKGYGDDIGINPIYWELSIQTKSQDIPYYALEWSNKYLKLNPIDRVILIVDQLFNEVREKFDSLSEARKTQIMFIKFDTLISDTQSICNRLENFLDASKTKRTSKIMSKQKVPKVFDKSLTDGKYENICQIASKSSLKILDHLISNYENCYAVL
jgi:hypothetical protein